MAIESLDVLYLPSRDVEADQTFYELTRPAVEARFAGRADFG